MAYFNQDDRRDNNRSFGGRRNFGNRGGQDRQMYPAVCHECGRECQVPFFPDGSKPVYCSNCFEKNQGGASQNRGGGGRQFEEKRGNQNQTNDLLVSINSKLGKILELMTGTSKPNKKEEGKKSEKEFKGKPIEKIEIKELNVVEIKSEDNIEVRPVKKVKKEVKKVEVIDEVKE